MRERKLVGMVYEGIDKDLQTYTKSIRGTNLLLLLVVGTGFLILLGKLNSIEKELKKLKKD